MVGGAVPRLMLIGEGVEVSRALAVSSQAGRVRASRNVFSHLEKNLDFVSEEAGWIECAGMEVESFWIRFRVPKTFQSTLSDHSVDSGVELEKTQPDSGVLENGDNDHGEQGTPERDNGPGGQREKGQHETYPHRMPKGVAETTFSYKQPANMVMENETSNQHHHPPHLVPAVHIINAPPSKPATPLLNGSAYSNITGNNPSHQYNHQNHRSLSPVGSPTDVAQRREVSQAPEKEQDGVWYIPVSTHAGRSLKSPHTALEDMESSRAIHNVYDNQHYLQHSRHGPSELLTPHPGELFPPKIHPFHVETGTSPRDSRLLESGQSSSQPSPLPVPHNKHPMSRPAEHEGYGGYLLVPHAVSHSAGSFSNAHASPHSFKSTEAGYFDSHFPYYSPSLRVPQPSGTSIHERYNAHYFTPLSPSPHMSHPSELETEELAGRNKWMTPTDPVPSSGQVSSTSLTRFPVLLPPLPQHSPMSSPGADGGERRHSRQRVLQNASHSVTPITSRSSFSGCDENGDRDIAVADRKKKNTNSNSATIRQNKQSSSPVRNDRSKTLPGIKSDNRKLTTNRDTINSASPVRKTDTARVTPGDKGRHRSTGQEGTGNRDSNRTRDGSRKLSSSPIRPGQRRSRSLGRTSKKSNKVHPHRKK
ncbi:hypothetical protein ACOMHN_045204 [Nucella lapillus]